MSDYPDPDEEYELMYADEFELLRETEENSDVQLLKNVQAKRTLNFSNTSVVIPTTTENISGIEPLPSSQNLESSQNNTLNGNKRSVDYLFGDIDDIDFDSIQLPSKRHKTEEEEDLELIDKIVGIRNAKHTLLESSSSNKESFSGYNYDRKEFLSTDIPRWPFIPVTNSDGDRIYVKLDSEDYWEYSLDSMDHSSWLACYSSVWDEAREILEKKEKESQSLFVDSPVIQENTSNTELWVDKYKPHSYLDLLSEEPVNRALLHWLHLWDKIVFKKEVHTREPQQRNSFSKRAGKFQMANKWRGKKEAEAELDEDGRPHHKVALLCGPPGVGKTTLAHLLATLAGYRPVELNASDERSTEAFQTALQSATLMKSVIDAERRPNCLILDEIDGAPQPTVELLVKWCTAMQSDNAKKKKTHPLRRPVIAICNELYSPALRSLRPISLVLRVPGVSAVRLSKRLASVASAEGVRAAPRALAELAARAQGDLRAAIHLLCFLKAKERDQLTVEDVHNSAFGTKDCGVNTMQALQSVFTVDDCDFARLVNRVQACGEYDRMVDGVFENYLTARVDSRMLVASETLSWLRLYDECNSWIQKTQNYSIYAHLPLYIAACHRVLATRTPPKLKFPSTSLEAHRQSMEIEGIVQSVRSTGSRSVLRLDILPLLPYILAPTLRSPNVQLCSESERATLRTCAGALCDYGLSYVQRRGLDGLYTHVLEPDIHRVAFMGSEERVRPSPAVRQAIAQEHQLEVIRRNEQMMNRCSVRTNAASKKDVDKDAKAKTIATQRVKDDCLPNHLRTLTPMAVAKSKPQVHKDFFGRIVPVSQVRKSSSVPDAVSSSGVFYQYREGYNNAVRRAVRMRDLL